MITGLVSIKVVAHVVGPAGIAMVGQFLNSISMVSLLGTGGIGQGVTKYIAEYYDEPEKQKSVIVQAVRVTAFSTLVMSLLVIVLSGPFGLYIFKSHDYTLLVILFGISIAFYSFNTLLISILNGFKSFRKFVAANIASSLFGLALSLFLVLQYGLFGALLNCVASQSVIIIVTLLYVYKEPWFKTLFARMRPDWKVIKRLGGFSLMALTSAIVVPLSQITIRSYIVKHLSIHDAGIWEGINRFSAMFLLVITSSLSIYYLPRLSEIRDSQTLRHEIIKAMKIILPTLLVACLAIYITRDIIIWLIFSPEFVPMRDLFAFQLIGNFFKIASFLLAFLLLARGMTRMYIITELLFGASLVYFSELFISKFDLSGAVMGYALNYFVYFLLLLYVFRKLLFPSIKGQ